MSNAVIIEEADRNVIVRFNRPEIRSPLSISVLETVAAIVDDIERRDDIGRMIFTSSTFQPPLAIALLVPTV